MDGSLEQSESKEKQIRCEWCGGEPDLLIKVYPINTEMLEFAKFGFINLLFIEEQCGRHLICQGCYKKHIQ
jgi:hypothetical protein